jgi:hypothetical protein
VIGKGTLSGMGLPILPIASNNTFPCIDQCSKHLHTMEVRNSTTSFPAFFWCKLSWFYSLGMTLIPAILQFTGYFLERLASE